MLYLGARRALLSSGKAWNPSLLFAPGDLGTWQTSSLPTIYQDSAGITPVITVGNPIGLRLDNGLGLVRGSQVVIDGGFDADTSNWIPASGITQDLVSGEMRLTTNGAGYTSQYAAANALEIGKTYEISASIRPFTAEGVPSNLGRIQFTSGFPGFLEPSTGLRKVLVATATTLIMQAGVASSSVLAAPGGYCFFDNISVRELPGNHASQATTTARPAYRTIPVPHVDYDGIDDVLVTTFPSSLGSNCTIVRAIPGVGAVILTGQTIGTTYSDNVDNCELFIINRPLTALEIAKLSIYFDAKAQANPANQNLMIDELGNNMVDELGNFMSWN